MEKLFGLVQASAAVFGDDGGDQPVTWWTANVGVEEEAFEEDEPRGSEVSPERQLWICCCWTCFGSLHHPRRYLIHSLVLSKLAEGS